MRLDLEVEVAQDLRPEPVAQSHVLESDQAQLRSIGREMATPSLDGDRKTLVRPLWFPIR